MWRRRTVAVLMSAGQTLASAPAAAQSLEQVQGFVATGSLHYRASFANMLGSAPGLVTYYYRVRIADGAAQATVSREVEAITSLGLGKSSASHSFSGRIAESRPPDFGQAMWSFANGTLTLLDPSQTGGMRLTIRFLKDQRGILCQADAAYSPDNSPAGKSSRLAFGGQVMIVGMQPIRNYCEVGTR